MCTSTTMSTSSTSSISQDQQKQEHDSHGFTPLLQSLRKDKLRHTDNAIVKMLPPSNQLSCESIPDMVAGNLSHAKINSLRRQLMIKDTECFQTHAALFMDVFQHRLLTKHVMLHIPKAGGTSICDNVKQERTLVSPGGNCWKEDFCPLWCGCEHPQTTTCPSLNKWSADFVMNENWLDGFCDHHSYSILIREPMARTMSHINHFLNAVVSRGEHFYGTTNWRLSLIQSNYMTWALTAFSAMNTETETDTDTETQHQHPSAFHPGEEHLPIAMAGNIKMDYIVNLEYPNDTCTSLLLHNMRIKNKIRHSNSAHVDYTKEYSRVNIAEMNELDIQLYNFANVLIGVDCTFMGMVNARDELS